VHHTARERDRDQGSETEHRTLHGAIRGGGPGRIQGSGRPLETAPHAHRDCLPCFVQLHRLSAQPRFRSITRMVCSTRRGTYRQTPRFKRIP
jgi:hypothetical protein